MLTGQTTARTKKRSRRFLTNSAPSSRVFICTMTKGRHVFKSLAIFHGCGPAVQLMRNTTNCAYTLRLGTVEDIIRCIRFDCTSEPVHKVLHFAIRFTSSTWRHLHVAIRFTQCRLRAGRVHSIPCTRQKCSAAFVQQVPCRFCTG